MASRLDLHQAWIDAPDRESAHGVIRAAAYQLLQDEGARAITMRKLATRIGISAMTAYRYYADKDALLLDLKGLIGEGFAQVLRAAAEQETEPLERLRAAGFAYLDFALDHEQDYRLLFDIYIEAAPALADKPHFAKASWFFLIALLESCAPEAAEKELSDTAHFIWSTVHGLAMLHLSGRMPLQRPVRQSAAFHIDALVAPLREKAGCEP